MTTTHATFARLERALLDAISELRSELQQNDTLHHIRFEIEASGRLHDGDIKVQFHLGEYYTPAVTGDSLDAVLEEFARRRNWQLRHDALLLPNTADANAPANNEEQS